MSPRSALSILLVMAGLAVAAAACSGGGQPIDTGETGDDDDIVYDATFGGGAFPAMANEDCGENSGSCHNVNDPGGTDLHLPDSGGALGSSAAFTEITNPAQNPLILNIGAPASSLLLTKGLGTGHGGGQQWADTDETYIATLAWISSGAQLN